MGKKGFLNQKLGKRVTRKVQLLKSELSSATRSSYPVPPTSKPQGKGPSPHTTWCCYSWSDPQSEVKTRADARQRGNHGPSKDSRHGRASVEFKIFKRC